MTEADPAFLAFLKEEEERAYDGTMLEEVEAAINSYNGQPYGDEEDGRSQVVARDVAEVIDHMTVSMLRTFVSGDRVVELEPSTQAEEQAADDATEALTADLRRSGYRLIHDWIKAGLLEKYGVVKSCVEKDRERVESMIPSAMLPGETEEELRAAGIIEAEEAEHDEFGQPVMHRVVTLQESVAEFKEYNVPLEEFGFSPDTRDLDSSPYLHHKCRKSISELVRMGFDYEHLAGVSDNGWSSGLASARDDGRNGEDIDRKGALRKVWYLEEYVLYDLNGDGIAERLMVCRVGNEILIRDGKLAIEEIDEQPFDGWTPFPMPNRLVGQSLADKVLDIQRVNTVLERSMLDSLYAQLRPGTFVHEDTACEHTFDDLLTLAPNRIVRFKGNMAPIPEVRTDVSGVAIQAIEFKIGQRESRTGITRMNQGLDADALNKTATGTAMMQAQGQQIEEYLARNFAEALSRMFRRKLKMMARHGQPFEIRVDGEFRQVDPSQWGEDMDVNIRVGLGTGKKDQRVMYRQQLIQLQAMGKQAGMPGVDDEKVYNAVAGLVKDMGLGSPNDYWNPPQRDEQGNVVQPEPQPDPEQMKAQAELQLKQQAHESDMQLKGADLQAKQQEASLKLELERAKAEEAAQLAREKAEFEREQAVAQMMFEREMRQQELEHERALSFYKADKDAEAKKYRDGGSLAA